MLKLTALAIGLLTAISIAPAAQAANIGGSAPTIHQASDNLHAQIIIKVGGSSDDGHDRYRDGYHRRQAELAREREAYEARVQWESEQRRRQRQYARYRRSERRDWYRNDGHSNDGHTRGVYRH
jgi:hypothetical protein